VSAKIGVLKAGARADSQPYRWVKRAVSAFLLNKQICEAIAHNVIRERPIREVRDVHVAQTGLRLFIPEKMPPREIPNTWFQEPQSPSWRLAHRMTVLHG
jgi:hypothetical protein